ncbi:UDP-glycosyltransferase UGT5-like [Schistocerca serialis cubense]|uniref:UDP-glycosyltransferase UGT5-like n=1 Tax=Schistocerca serialis cubense TaxID=2023355 RepID=UPI00214F1DAA|nr:UDP-glycosyltransferase UGT5-like [Schistocerca serialis cubense]
MEFDFVEYGSLSPFTQQTVVSGIGRDVCRRLMDDPGVRYLIDSRQRTYDLLITEGFFYVCFLAFSHKYRAPTVLTCAFGGGGSWNNHPMGNPYPLAYLPEAGLAYSSSMSLFQKTYNTLFSLAINLHRVLVYFPVMDEMDLQEFMDAAAEGVIYFSMGSNVKSTDLSEEVRAVFLKTFARLRQKVLWKLEGDSLPNQPANLRISSWFPQSDLLGVAVAAHRNMRLFITHGGMVRVLEALYAGVPLLGFPIFGDQVWNLLRARDSGYGLVLHLRNITQESFDWAVNELMTDPRYAENARKLSRLFHDRPEPPLETAVRSVQ